MWLFELFFPQFCKSDMSRYGYFMYFRGSLGIRDNESQLYKILPFIAHFLICGNYWAARPAFIFYGNSTPFQFGNLIFHNISFKLSMVQKTHIHWLVCYVFPCLLFLSKTSSNYFCKPIHMKSKSLYD